MIFFATQCYASAAYVIMRCLSACVSVTFVNSVKTNKRIVKIFFTIGLPHHSIFSVANGIAVLQWEPPPLTGASIAGGGGRNRDSEPISACC